MAKTITKLYTADTVPAGDIIKSNDDYVTPVVINKVTVEYTQNGDTAEGDVIQVLTLTTENNGVGDFIRMSIGDADEGVSKFWSIDTDNIEEQLMPIFNHFLNCIKPIEK